MKAVNQKEYAEKLGTPRNSVTSSSATRALLPKLMIWLLLFVSMTYLVYTLKLISTPPTCLNENPQAFIEHSRLEFHSHKNISLLNESTESTDTQEAELQKSDLDPAHKKKKLEMKNIVFGIAASASLWEQRKNYIKLWYSPENMKAVVWLDKPVKEINLTLDRSLPPLMISSDTSQFAYKNRQGHRSAIRISRIVSETFNLSLPGVRWFVMGDDDTVFVADNLVRVLSKFDDSQYWYIGSLSESHLQNIYFSYGMAYGGGGFAISYPLAAALYRIHDKCIARYPALYGSDDRMHACMAELGVPLTKHLGFHQYDVYGNLFGLLAAHPVTPLVTMHHLDVVEPIFPNMTRVQALKHLMAPMRLDSAGLMQQSICYEKDRMWTISVSWGFAVQIIRGIFSAREMEMPTRTFLNWYRRADYTAYAFNTRPVARNPCQKPYVFYMSAARFDAASNQTVTDYVRHRVPHPACKWKMADPAVVERIRVFKKPDPHLWDKSPRRNCCRILPSKKKTSMTIEVGVCREGEISEVQ